MEGYKYAIVKFTSENDQVGVVCTSWIKDNMCYYPKSDKEVTQALKKELIPTIHWKMCPIQVMKEYETFKDARKDLNKATETSNLDTDQEESTKRKRRPRTFSFEEEDDVQTKISKISAYPSLDSFKKSESIITSQQELMSPENSQSPSLVQSQILESSPLHSPVIIPSSIRSSAVGAATPSQNLEPDNNRTFIVIGQLQATVADLVQEIRIMHKKLDAISASKSESTTDESFSKEMILLGKLPLTSLEDFEANEENLKEVRYHNLLVKVLVTLGGRDCRSYTYNILRRLMTCELATKFSFTGKQPKDKLKGKKRAFCETLLYKSVQASLRKIYPDTKEDEMKGHISLWLQQAQHRINQRDGKLSLASGCTSIFNSSS